MPDGPVDGVGLMAAADFVVGLGGVMLREAAALGTPAYTLSSSAGPVEASLLADGRLTRAAGPDDILLRKKDTRTALGLPRDPWLFADGCSSWRAAAPGGRASAASSRTPRTSPRRRWSDRPQSRCVAEATVAASPACTGGPTTVSPPALGGPTGGTVWRQHSVARQR